MSRENVKGAPWTWELWSTGADDEVARRLEHAVEHHHKVGVGTRPKRIYRGREEESEALEALGLAD